MQKVTIKFFFIDFPLSVHMLRLKIGEKSYGVGEMKKFFGSLWTKICLNITSSYKV